MQRRGEGRGAQRVRKWSDIYTTTRGTSDRLWSFCIRYVSFQRTHRDNHWWTPSLFLFPIIPGSSPYGTDDGCVSEVGVGVVGGVWTSYHFKRSCDK